jgi:hypothetical protein
MSEKDCALFSSDFCNFGSVNKLAGTIAMRKSNDWTQYNLNLPMAQTSPFYQMKKSRLAVVPKHTEQILNGCSKIVHR